jgi:hypothetical protein
MFLAFSNSFGMLWVRRAFNQECYERLLASKVQIHQPYLLEQRLGMGSGVASDGLALLPPSEVKMHVSMACSTWGFGVIWIATRRKGLKHYW